MQLNRVFIDQSRRILAVHPIDQLNISAAEYAREGVAVRELILPPEATPHGIARPPVFHDNGTAEPSVPEYLDAEWVDGYLAPSILGVSGKLALLDADLLDDVEAAIAALEDRKVARALQLQFDAANWTREGAVLAFLRDDLKLKPKQISEIWAKAAEG